MKKIFSYILFLFLLTSCKDELKKTNVPVLQKESPVIDSSSSSEKNIEIDKQTQLLKNSAKNVFQKKEEETPYKVESISELWKQYKSSKTNATKYISEKKLDSIIVYLNLAADAAYKLSREDIATWQLNNIGYYSIDEFKKQTDYERRVQQLATMLNLKKKGLYLEETKAIFKEHFQILSNAKKYLYKAKLLDSELEKSDRSEIIERNLQFIEWVGDFISDGSREEINE